jgi:hypothetical protein
VLIAVTRPGAVCPSVWIFCIASLGSQRMVLIASASGSVGGPRLRPSVEGLGLAGTGAYVNVLSEPDESRGAPLSADPVVRPLWRNSKITSARSDGASKDGNFSSVGGGVGSSCILAYCLNAEGERLKEQGSLNVEGQPCIRTEIDSISV